MVTLFLNILKGVETGTTSCRRNFLSTVMLELTNLKRKYEFKREQPQLLSELLLRLRSWLTKILLWFCIDVYKSFETLFSFLLVLRSYYYSFFVLIITCFSFLLILGLCCYYYSFFILIITRSFNLLGLVFFKTVMFKSYVIFTFSTFPVISWICNCISSFLYNSW